MGYNLISCCHKHKVKMLHFRKEEQKTIHPFYVEHKQCAKEDINNVQTVIDSNGEDPFWTASEKDGGYKEV